MSYNSSNLYVASSSGVPVTLTDDIMQLRVNTGIICAVKEIRVFQTNITSLEQLAIQISRGSGGATGTGIDRNPMDTRSPTAVATAHTLPGTSLSSTDMVVNVGWNLLQEMVWLPTPELELLLKESDMLALSLASAPAASTTIGFSISWEEIGI